MNPSDPSQKISRLVPLSGISSSVAEPADRARWLCEQLESGHILFFPESPFRLPPEDREFLLGLRQTSAAFHKNIAYRPLENRLTGLDKKEPADRAQRMRAILRDYSDRVTEILREVLLPYATNWRRDLASFRPLEERGRPLRLRARNDLLHTDAFPTRPTGGDRILRVFTNLNPSEPRVWHTAETFEALAARFARTAGLPRPAPSGPLARRVARLAQRLKIPGANRSPYDRFMLRFHNFLKENGEFQETCVKQRWEFPPGSAWIVFTDMVSHAVLSGQFALEQTYLVPRAALVAPERAPVAILEKICGYPLVRGAS